MRIGLNRYRHRLLVLIVVITPLGFASKAWSGPASFWVANSLSGVLYVAFWMLVVGFLAVGWRPLAIAVGVFLVTSVLEVLQLWHPPWLEALRATFLGATLLGNTFVVSDFLYYALGAVVGAGLLRWARAGQAANGRCGSPNV